MQKETNLTVAEQVDALRPWYHSIMLPDGTITPGEPYEAIWDNITDAMHKENYGSKSVLDIGSFDGKWAFLAEALGASSVIATDCNWKAFRNFMFVHRLLKSNAVPFYNVPVQKLRERLDSYFEGLNVDWVPHDQAKRVEFVTKHSDPRFDIVQFFGVLYHLPDPLQALFQIRSVIKPGGVLLIETVTSPSVVGIEINAGFQKIYDDTTTYFAPSIDGLRAMLAMALFDCNVVGTVEYPFPRVVVRAVAIPPTDNSKEVVFNHYRCGGIHL